VVDQKVDLALEEVFEDNNRLTFTARSITKDFVCEKGLQRLAEDSKNKHLVWRHEHPLIPKYKTTHIYGRVLESQVINGQLMTKYELYNHTLEHKGVATDLKARDFINKPLSVSMRFRYYENNEGVPIHYDVIEHSLTPTPACKECVILDIKNEVNNMTEELEKLIKELEAKLTKKDKVLEQLESKVTTLESDITVKDSELEKAKEEKDKFAEQLVSFKDKLNEQSKTIDELKESRRMDKLMPLIEKLLEHDGEEMKDLYLMKAKQDDAEKFFKDRIAKKDKELESKPMAHTKSLGSTAQDSIKEKELEDEDLKKQRDAKAFENMPEAFFK